MFKFTRRRPTPETHRPKHYRSVEEAIDHRIAMAVSADQRQAVIPYDPRSPLELLINAPVPSPPGKPPRRARRAAGRSTNVEEFDERTLDQLISGRG